MSTKPGARICPVPSTSLAADLVRCTSTADIPPPSRQRHRRIVARIQCRRQSCRRRLCGGIVLTGTFGLTSGDPGRSPGSVPGTMRRAVDSEMATPQAASEQASRTPRLNRDTRHAWLTHLLQENDDGSEGRCGGFMPPPSTLAGPEPTRNGYRDNALAAYEIQAARIETGMPPE